MLGLLQGLETAGWERFGAYAGMLFVFTMFLRYFGQKIDAHTQAISALAVEMRTLATTIQNRPCLSGDK